MTVLLNSFHVNAYALQCHPQNQKRNHLVQQNKQHHRKVLQSSFHINGQRIIHENKRWTRTRG